MKIYFILLVIIITVGSVTYTALHHGMPHRIIPYRIRSSLPSSTSTVWVTKVNCSVNCVLNASIVVNDYVLDQGLGDLGNHNASFSLSDTARFSRLSWDCGAWGTQGELITEKMLSLGRKEHIRLVRRWLLNTPQLPSGEVFSTEGSLYHSHSDGKMEANAEFILSSALFAAHSGEHSLFNTIPDRLVCYVDASNKRRLASGFGKSLNDSACSTPLNLLENAHHDEIYAQTLNGAFVAHTEGATMNASGSALVQHIIVPHAFTALSLPLRPYKHMQQPCWPVTSLLYNAKGKLLWSAEINISNSGWMDLVLQNLIEAGNYTLKLWPSMSESGRSQSIFTSPAWLTNVNYQAKNKGGAHTLTFLPDTPIGEHGYKVPPTLAKRLVMAMQWQLSFASTDNSIGVMKINQSNWRGVAADDVGASSAMWDLIRSGYKDSYLNVRFIESISAMLELQAAGLTSDTKLVSLADLLSAKSAFVSTFASNGSYLSWIGCDRVSGSHSDCSGPEKTYERPVNINFVPALALVAKLDMRSEGREKSLLRFDSVRDAARNVNGRFRTNLIPIEAVNPVLWRASSKWKLRDTKGFAIRSKNQSGDWQIFADPYKDGYGQWGNTEENGGILLSTTSLVFSAGIYPEMFSDFESLVTNLTAISEQLAAGENGTHTPLLSKNRDMLRESIIHGSVPSWLCQQARHLIPTEPADRFGDHWCDYYKSVSFNLPSAGAFVYAFAKGLLSLHIPIQHNSLIKNVLVYGTSIVSDSDLVQVDLPVWVQKRWPPEVGSIGIDGINVAGTTHSLNCTIQTVTMNQLLCFLKTIVSTSPSTEQS